MIKKQRKEVVKLTQLINDMTPEYVNSASQLPFDERIQKLEKMSKQLGIEGMYYTFTPYYIFVCMVSW